MFGDEYLVSFLNVIVVVDIVVDIVVSEMTRRSDCSSSRMVTFR